MLTKTDILSYLAGADDDVLFARARAVRQRVYGNAVYVRGLVEFSSRCVNDCRYCGLRRSNRGLRRYRMADRDILAAAGRIYADGVRTVVLQSGDDPGCTADMLCRVVRAVREQYPGMAVTLSVGERSDNDYRAFAAAGTDRFLLRHEAADPALYRLHHPGKRAQGRQRILRLIRDAGMQAGAGFMVGLPYQTLEHIADDILYLQDFRPAMAGIGPFIPHKDTPWHAWPAGGYRLTLRALALARIAVPGALMPATTALSTLNPQTGLIDGFNSGCNVVMVDYTPEQSRRLYTLYDDKAAVTRGHLEKSAAAAGMKVDGGRGDAGGEVRSVNDECRMANDQ